MASGLQRWRLFRSRLILYNEPMSFSFIKSTRFWFGFVSGIILLGVFFAWELTLLQIPSLPQLPRPTPTDFEMIFTCVLIFFLSLDAGLLNWHLGNKSCPIGVKRATAVSGVLGVVTLLCPVCLLIPLSLYGLTLSLTFLVPFLPLLRTIVLILLIATTIIMWPKTRVKMQKRSVKTKKKYVRRM